QESKQVRDVRNGACLVRFSPTWLVHRAVFFFFQAEDGIRDLIVTGVQTCALPISRSACSSSSRGLKSTRIVSLRSNSTTLWETRSEERRVGKECRTRWSPYL